MNKLLSMFMAKRNQIISLIAAAKKLKHDEHRRQVKLALKYRLFVFERRWQIHPVFRYIYPANPKRSLRTVMCVIAALITTLGLLVYFAPDVLHRLANLANPKDPVLYWAFDESSENSDEELLVHDSSGNNNTGTIIGDIGDGTFSMVHYTETAFNSVTTPKTTSSFNVEAGDVIVAYGFIENAGDVPNISTPTGGSLSWSLEEEMGTGGGNSWIAAWTATVDSNKTMDVTFTKPGNVSTFFGGNVYVFRGSSGIGTSTEDTDTSSVPTVDLLTTQDNSAIVFGSNDWNAIDGSSRTWLTNAGTFTEELYFRDSIRYTIFGGYHANAGPAGTYTVGLSSPGPQRWGAIAVEVLEDPSNGTSSPWRNKDMCLFERNCVRFDGTGDTYAKKDYSSDTELDPSTNSFTVAGWFRHPTAISSQQNIITRTDGVNGVGYKVYMLSNGKVCFGIDASAGSFPSDDACSTSSYADNKWHYVHGVKNGTTDIVLYIDGKEIDGDNSIPGTSLSGTSSPFIVGADFDGTSNTWNGFIDEVKYYDYARSPAEIKADYNSKGSIVGAAATFGVADANSSLNQGLVGYWKLDDGVNNPCPSGVDKACDSSGNDNVGTWTNGVASTSGKFGNATTYDGSNDYINVADNASLNMTSAITVAAWINADTFGGGNGRILQKGANDDQYRLLDTNDRLRFNVTGVTNGDINAPLPSTGAWHHVVGTYDSVKHTIRIFVDGEIVSERTDATGNINTTADALNIGNKTGSAVAGDHFDGKIDDVRIYNRALSPREITNLYDWAPAPIAWWKMDERTGTKTYDSSRNGNTGTLTGGPTWISGKMGAGIDFDGIDDTVAAGAASSLNNLPQFTLSGWVKPTVIGGSEFIAGKEELRFRFDGGNQLRFEKVASTTNLRRESVNDVITPGEWQYVTFTWDGSTAQTGVHMYVNGVEVGYSTGADLSGVFNSDSSFNFTLGSRNSSSAFYNGGLDDMKLYNYVRTSKQIISDMNGGHPAVGSPIASALGHWKFDDGFGNVASNSGSLGSTANGGLHNISSPPTGISGWTNHGKHGKALTFDGSNDYVNLGNTIDLSGNTAMTLSAWVNLKATPGSQGQIIAKYDQGVSGEWWLGIESGRRVSFLRECGGFGLITDVNATVPLNTWTHVMGIYDGTSLKIYINGKLVKQKVDSCSITGVAKSITIGAGGAGSELFLNATLDDVKVYNYALNDNEIKVEYNQGKAIVLGSLSQNPDGSATNSATRFYCPPGDSSGNCAITANPAPVAEWKLDERTKNKALDTSGNGLHGTLVNSPTWVTGKVGAGLNFNGTNSQVTVPDSSRLEPTGDMSFSFWTKLNRTSVNKGSLNMFMYKEETIGPPWYSYQVYQDMPTDEFGVNWMDSAGNTYFVDGNTPLVANRWYHLTFVKSGTELRVYVNGWDDSNRSETTSANPIFNSDSFLYFGGIGSTFLDGVIDDFRMYNYARTPAQVAWDYNKGKPAVWYKFDECSGSTIFDVAPTASGSASGVNGAWSGGGGTNTSAGTCGGGGSEARANGATGKFNYSLDFDGTDDTVTVANHQTIWLNRGLKRGFTISTWVNADDAGEGSLGQIFSKGTNTYCRTKNPVGNHLDLECNLDFVTTDANLTVGNAFDTGGWHNVVMTYDGSNQIKIWIDGKLRGTSAAGSGGFASELNSLILGNNSAGSATFNGRMDNFMVFNYEMNAVMMKTLYNEFAAVRFGPASGSP